MKTDLELLSDVLEAEAETSLGLDDVTRRAFEAWYSRLSDGFQKTLTPKQREWLERVATHAGVDAGSANLVSAGVVKPTDAERAGLKQFHESLGPKPLKPPGRN